MYLQYRRFASPHELMFGRKLRGIFPEVKRKTDYPDDDKIQKHDREQKDNMKTSAGKRRRTSLKRTKRTA